MLSTPILPGIILDLSCVKEIEKITKKEKKRDK